MGIVFYLLYSNCRARIDVASEICTMEPAGMKAVSKPLGFF